MLLELVVTWKLSSGTFTSKSDVSNGIKNNGGTSSTVLGISDANGVSVTVSWYFCFFFDYR